MSELEDGLTPAVAAAIGGDRAAVERLLAEVRPLVVRYCRARIGRQERSFASADGVAQEVCLAVLTALPGYRSQGQPFLAFVYGIAARTVAGADRAGFNGRVSWVPGAPNDMAQVGVAQPATSGGESARMAALLRVLPAKQREVMVLRAMVGLSVEDTATAVGSTPDGVRVTQHRALTRLRRALAAQEVV
jgi:RNA polymerase sigma-70 factor (ECF subfamily)